MFVQFCSLELLAFSFSTNEIVLLRDVNSTIMLVCLYDASKHKNMSLVFL